MEKRSLTETLSEPLTRRRFVATAGVAASAATIAPLGSLAAEAPAPSPSGCYDVIIIGGGFCGVTAARECRRAGYRTLLLEARNRLGGRTFTADLNGERAEMGGTYVHWSQPYVWSEIKRSGLGLRETMGALADKLIFRRSNGEVVTLSNSREAPRFEQAMIAYMGDSRGIVPLPHNPFGSDEYRKFDGISSAERVASLRGISDLHRDMLDAYFANDGGAYADNLAWIETLRWYALAGHNLMDMSDSQLRFQLKDGTKSLINALMAEGGPELRLGTPVSGVLQEESSITVITTSGEKFRASAVVSTIPLNVLKDIDWHPSLKEGKLAASRETHAGFGTMLHVILEGDYGNLNCAAPSHNPLNFLFTDAIANGHTHLIGYGPNPELLDVNDTQSVQHAVRLFIPNAKVSQAFGYEWTLDPYSKGTWCTLRPGMWSKYLRDLQEPRGKLIFASADWANGWRGFIDGAIEQGLEAGRRVKALLG